MTNDDNGEDRRSSGDGSEPFELRTGGALDVLRPESGADDPLEGRILAGYAIEALVASGGMGRVYRARRADGKLERDVAIKVLLSGSLSAELRARFDREQRVLASLNHPNIAQLYDARVSDDGLPFIVMEFVAGDSISAYCVDNDLAVEARLQLLAAVVDAVAYAHVNLVVHRDIKPANVLVGADGRPKLLDFGIAKLLENESDLTRTAPMTPRYASPEQLLGQPISVASDIAQLGVLVYECLSGKALNPDETITDAIQRAAEQRALRLPSDHGLPRELALIIEQCLRPDPNDRYRDANSLKADLEAYIDGYPVTAVGQSPGYRFRKLIARNRATSLAAAVTLLAVTAGVSWYTWQLAEARDLAERRAETTSRVLETMSELVTDTFSGLIVSSTERGAGDESYIEAVLSDASAVIERELQDEDAARAELLRVRGMLEMVLGNLEPAAAALEAAYGAIDRHEYPQRALRVLLDRIEISTRLADMETAHRMLDEARGIQDTVELSTDLSAYYQHQVGQVLQLDGSYEEAVAAFEEAVGLLEDSQSEDTRLLAETYTELAFTYSQWERHAESAEKADTAIAILEATESGVSHRLVNPLRFAGFSRLMLGETETARQHYERARRIAEAAFGEIHPDNAAIHDSLGALAYREGRYADAAAHFEQMIVINRQLSEDNLEDLVVPYVNAGLVYADMGNMAKAGEYHRLALESVDATDPSARRVEFVVASNEARRLYAVGDFASAAEWRERSTTVGKTLFGEVHHSYVRELNERSLAMLRAGRAAEAREVWDEGFRLYAELMRDEPERIEARTRLSWRFDRHEGREEEALAKLHSLIVEKVEADDLEVIYWVEWLGEYASHSIEHGDLETARQMLDWAAIGTAKAPRHPFAVYADVVEAEYLVAIGRRDEARARASSAAARLEELYPLRTEDLRRARAVLTR